MKGCKVFFIMMDSNFEDDVFDTWLGILLGSDMWYPLWDSSQIFSTASALVQLISGQDASASPRVSIPSPPSSGKAQAYPVWHSSQLSPTASPTPHFFSGQDAVTSPFSVPSTPSSNNSKAQMTPKPTKPADFEAAWILLQKPSFAALPATLTTMLDELGITSAEDLSLLDDDVMKITLTNLMKPVQRAKLKEAFGYSG